MDAGYAANFNKGDKRTLLHGKGAWPGMEFN